MDIEEMTNNEIWDHINQWTRRNRPYWGDIKPLVYALDMTQTSHRMMLSHIVRFAVENDQLDFLKDAVADNIPVFDADHCKLRIGPTHYQASLIDVIDQDTVNVKLRRLKVQRRTIPYEGRARKRAFHFDEEGGSYLFRVSHQPRTDDLIEEYIAWFRGFFEHHVMNNLPHGIQTRSIQRYNVLEFMRQGDGPFWFLIINDHETNPDHARPFSDRLFML